MENLQCNFPLASALLQVPCLRGCMYGAGTAAQSHAQHADSKAFPLASRDGRCETEDIEPCTERSFLWQDGHSFSLFQSPTAQHHFLNMPFLPGWACNPWKSRSSELRNARTCQNSPSLSTSRCFQTTRGDVSFVFPRSRNKDTNEPSLGE